jgi:hypothetical protein
MPRCRSAFLVRGCGSTSGQGSWPFGLTIKQQLSDRGLGSESLREGIDTGTAAGRTVAGDGYRHRTVSVED